MARKVIQNKKELVQELLQTSSFQEVAIIAVKYGASPVYCQRLKREAATPHKVVLMNKPVQEAKDKPDLAIYFDESERDLLTWIVEQSVKEKRTPQNQVKWILEKIKDIPDIIFMKGVLGEK